MSGIGGVFSNKKLLVALIGLAVVLGVFLVPRLFGDSKAKAVFGTCSESNSGLTLHGDTIKSAMPGGERSDEFMRARACLLSETGVPSTVEDRMMNTSAAVGKGDASWEGWKAAWTYSVEDGLGLSLTSK